MLPVGARLRHRPEFTATVRGGRRRAGRSALLVVHLLTPMDLTEREPARAGFVVARSVGNAVVRNRVRRRLRHLVAARLSELPPGSNLVIRALPGSASASSAALAIDLDQAIKGAVIPRQVEPEATSDPVTLALPSDAR